MIIEVRPTPALRRHRGRIVGTVVGAGLLAMTLLSVAELASPDGVAGPEVSVSDPIR